MWVDLSHSWSRAIISCRQGYMIDWQVLKKITSMRFALASTFLECISEMNWKSNRHPNQVFLVCALVAPVLSRWSNFHYKRRHSQRIDRLHDQWSEHAVDSTQKSNQGLHNVHVLHFLLNTVQTIWSHLKVFFGRDTLSLSIFEKKLFHSWVDRRFKVPGPPQITKMSIFLRQYFCGRILGAGRTWTQQLFLRSWESWSLSSFCLLAYIVLIALQMLESAIHSFDMMQTVCIRVQELVDDVKSRRQWGSAVRSLTWRHSASVKRARSVSWSYSLAWPMCGNKKLQTIDS